MADAHGDFNFHGLQNRQWHPVAGACRKYWQPGCVAQVAIGRQVFHPRFPRENAKKEEGLLFREELGLLEPSLSKHLLPLDVFEFYLWRSNHLTSPHLFFNLFRLMIGVSFGEKESYYINPESKRIHIYITCYAILSQLYWGWETSIQPLMTGNPYFMGPYKPLQTLGLMNLSPISMEI